METKAKKGFEVKALIGLGILFVVIAITLSFGSTILKDVQDDQVVDATQTIYNETVTTLSAAANDTLAGRDRSGFKSCSFTHASNLTVASPIYTAGNFTFNTAACSIGWITPNEDTNGFDNATSMNVTYVITYVSGAADYNATGYGLSSMETLTSWLPTLALIVIAAVIIGIIIRYFMVGRSEY